MTGTVEFADATVGGTTTVSVAMATYQGAAYVEEQLRSILDQSTPPAEIVVCDDRSSDDTVPRIMEVARSAAVPIRVVVNDERLGWRGNFMKAASLCGSEIIAFCDQDDVWDRRKLELVVAGFDRADTLVVFHDATVVGSDLRPIGRFLQAAGEPDRAAALERGPWRDVYGFTMAFRGELLALWAYWPSSVDKSVESQRAAHDQWLLFLGSVLGGTLHLPKALTSYRQHGGNAVGVKDAFRRTPRIEAFVRHRDVVNLRLVVLDSRIRILREMVRRPDRFGVAAAPALAVHEAYRERIALQTAVYSSHRISTRVRAFGSLLARGAYSSGVWALGRRQVADDGVAALLGPTAVARLRTWRLARRQSQSP